MSSVGNGVFIVQKSLEVERLFSRAELWGDDVRFGKVFQLSIARIYRGI